MKNLSEYAENRLRRCNGTMWIVIFLPVFYGLFLTLIVALVMTLFDIGLFVASLFVLAGMGLVFKICLTDRKEVKELNQKDLVFAAKVQIEAQNVVKRPVQPIDGKWTILDICPKTTYLDKGSVEVSGITGGIIARRAFLEGEYCGQGIPDLTDEPMVLRLMNEEGRVCRGLIFSQRYLRDLLVYLAHANGYPEGTYTFAELVKVADLMWMPDDYNAGLDELFRVKEQKQPITLFGEKFQGDILLTGYQEEDGKKRPLMLTPVVNNFINTLINEGAQLPKLC